MKIILSGEFIFVENANNEMQFICDGGTKHHTAQMHR